MTTKEAVRLALSQTRGNYPFDVDHIMDLIDNMPNRPKYTRDNVSRLIRATNGVKVLGRGQYKMGGRRVL